MKSIKKVSQNGQHYQLVNVSNRFIIYKYSMVTGNEGEYSDKIAEFKDKKKALEYWNKIK